MSRIACPATILTSDFPLHRLQSSFTRLPSPGGRGTLDREKAGKESEKVEGTSVTKSVCRTVEGLPLADRESAHQEQGISIMSHADDAPRDEDTNGRLLPAFLPSSCLPHDAFLTPASRAMTAELAFTFAATGSSLSVWRSVSGERGAG